MPRRPDSSPDSAPPPGELTELLRDWQSGDLEAGDRALPLLYERLRRLALWHMRRERSEHTLQPTALVHEAFLRLLGQRREWSSREDFLAAASLTMRRVLLDHAKHRDRKKRRRGPAQTGPAGDAPPDRGRLEAQHEIAEALESLAALDSGLAQLVELRFFVGLSSREIAALTDCSDRTIARRWRIAKAWLTRELSRR